MSWVKMRRRCVWLSRASLCHHLFTPLSHIDIIFIIDKTRLVYKCARFNIILMFGSVCMSWQKHLHALLYLIIIFLTVIWRLELRDVARLVLLFTRPCDVNASPHWTFTFMQQCADWSSFDNGISRELLEKCVFESLSRYLISFAWLVCAALHE